MFEIALAEACEAAAAVEIAGALGASSADDVRAIVALACRVKNVACAFRGPRRVLRNEHGEPESFRTGVPKQTAELGRGPR